MSNKYRTSKTKKNYIIINDKIQNKWNIFHLSCWYNNTDLLKEILNIPSLNKEYINSPDINGEPPIAICCYIDAIDCLILLCENGALKQFSNENNVYRVLFFFYFFRKI